MPERFAVLITLRREQEDACRRELGRVERDRAVLAEQRNALLSERDRAVDDAMAPSLREVYAAYWQRLTVEAEGLATRIAEADVVVAKARDAVIEARKAVRTIELLQERDRREQARRRERREGRRLDEFAAIHHHAREVS